MMKQCIRCGQEKESQEFHKDKGKKDGLCRYCKPCARERSRMYQSENRERILEENRTRYREDEEFRAAVIERSSRHYHTPEGKERAKQYARTAKVKERVKRHKQRPEVKKRLHRKGVEWRSDNPEYGREWFKNNPEKRAAYSRTARERHPLKGRARTAVHSAVYRKLMPRVTDLTCSYCPNKARHYHHHKGYEKEHWLDVVPVCRKCHDAIHAELRSLVSVVVP